jgi:hypothetical protein
MGFPRIETFGGNFGFFSIFTQVTDFRNYCQTNIGFDSIEQKEKDFRGRWKSGDHDSSHASGLQKNGSGI